MEVTGKTSGLFCAIVSFTDQKGRPLSGQEWSVRVFDRDLLLDDSLGLARLDNKGMATFLLPVADIKSADSPGERNPDLYFRLLRDGEEVFRSEVIEDVDFESLHKVSGDPVKVTREFGPYAVALED